MGIQGEIQTAYKSTFNITGCAAVSDQKDGDFTALCDAFPRNGAALVHEKKAILCTARQAITLFWGVKVTETLMQDGKKGFNPLASLFDAPNPLIDADVVYDGEEDSFSESSLEEIPDDFDLGSPLMTEEFEAKETQEVSKEELAKALAQAAIKQRPAAESRAAELAARSTQPLSAKAALKAAAKAEAEKRRARLRRRMNKLPAKVSRVLSRLLAGGEVFEVQNALVMDDRRVLKALWKAHRARMATDGLVDGVVATTNIIRALDAVAPGQLVAAVVTSKSNEFLVWVDLGSEATIAALPDARSWIG
jgi:hypothetical protein